MDTRIPLQAVTEGCHHKHPFTTPMSLCPAGSTRRSHPEVPLRGSGLVTPHGTSTGMEVT